LRGRKLSEKRVKDIFDLAIYTPLTLITKLDEIVIESLPDKYKKAAEHYLSAKMEMLKAINEIINIRIDELRELKDTIKSREVRKERVDIE
jgi:hypothetical protein